MSRCRGVKSRQCAGFETLHAGSLLRRFVASVWISFSRVDALRRSGGAVARLQGMRCKQEDALVSRERERERETGTKRQRETERDRERQRETERDRE